MSSRFPADHEIEHVRNRKRPGLSHIRKNTANRVSWLVRKCEQSIAERPGNETPEVNPFLRDLLNTVEALDRIERLRDQVADLHDQIAEWQSATGLNVGGDPSGVTPDDLRRYIGRVIEVVRLAASGDAATNQLMRMAREIQRDYPEETATHVHSQGTSE